jgi:hypothetical protein
MPLPCLFTPGTETCFSFYRRLEGCGKTRTASRFDSRTTKTIASRYTDWAILAQCNKITELNKSQAIKHYYLYPSPNINSDYCNDVEMGIQRFTAGRNVYYVSYLTSRNMTQQLETKCLEISCEENRFALKHKLDWKHWNCYLTRHLVNCDKYSNLIPTRSYVKSGINIGHLRKLKLNLNISLVL